MRTISSLEGGPASAASRPSWLQSSPGKGSMRRVSTDCRSTSMSAR